MPQHFLYAYIMLSSILIFFILFYFNANYKVGCNFLENGPTSYIFKDVVLDPLFTNFFFFFFFFEKQDFVFQSARPGKSASNTELISGGTSSIHT